MSSASHDGPQRSGSGATDVEVWLLGQPALSEYLDFVRTIVVGGAALDPAPVAAEWRAANAYYESLEKTQSGIADTARCEPLPASMAAQADQVRASPAYQKTYDIMPSEFRMVELDKLVVCQKSVTWTFVDAIVARLGAAPSGSALFDACVPVRERDLPVQAHTMGSGRFMFRSVSNDFRHHETTLLTPDQLRNYESHGPITNAVGVMLGFGSNFLSAVRVGKRLLLDNGYHRACALRALGVTHVPCVITTVATQDELEVVTKSSVARNADFYFKSHRPPLIRDYFDPKIRKAHTTHKLERIIEVTYKIKEYLVPM
jgi:hypothetical protein